MSIKRLVAIVIIFIITCIGWGILGSATWLRTDYFSGIMEDKIEGLYGKPIKQLAPALLLDGTAVIPEKNNIKVILKKDYRKKGLFWQSLFECNFNGQWEVINDSSETKTYDFHFTFPDPTGTYSEIIYLINDKKIRDYTINKGLISKITLETGQKVTFAVNYKTRGLNTFLYLPNKSGRLHNLDLSIHTDFEHDFADNTLSPSSIRNLDNLNELISIWKANDLITRQAMGVKLPAKLNPGPLASRITFFGPVCLIFFFVLIAVIDIVKKVGIHPMHYLFVSAGFFAFHLLFSYLVDQIDIQVSFWIAATTSVLLVIIYLKSALNKGFPWVIAALGQMCFLVLFSYSFFLKGTTGLTVAVGSVLTLAIIMKVTAKIDWEEVFSKDT